jgi:hypothetical protein
MTGRANAATAVCKRIRTKFEHGANAASYMVAKNQTGAMSGGLRLSTLVAWVVVAGFQCF